MDWMQSAMSLKGKCLRWKKNARSKVSAYPNIVAVLSFSLFLEFPSEPGTSVRP